MIDTRELESLWDDFEELKSLKEFYRQHPPQLDVLDQIYDCGSSECPSVGFHPGERDWHHVLWDRYDELAIDLGLVALGLGRRIR